MWRIALLGLIQGLTEFLPVSSSGHLIVLGRLISLPSSGAQLEVALHVGTLVAVFVGYRQELAQWIRELAAGHSRSFRFLGQLIVASVPAAVVGYWAGEWITQWFIPIAVAAGWGATTVALWLTPPAEHGHRSLESLSWGQAFIIGIFQAFALWPGLSRSGSTIFAGRVLGLSADDAAQLSFFMAIPVIAGAAFLILHKSAFSEFRIDPSVLVGMGVAAISGVFAIKWVKHALGVTRLWRQFGWYTLMLALLTWGLSMAH
ncbi:MAG: undecaprenyl-diphosphate phosphatase [Sulfobacillus thermotolerans]|nr:undecaprenyl-diphosphate phosphatase [Sulfobacillus thermotolerans]